MAEAAKAGHTNLEAGFRNGEAARGEEVFGAVDALADAKLMRRAAEDGFEFANKVEMGDAGLSGDVGQGEWSIGEEVAGPEEETEGSGVEDHSIRVARCALGR